MSVVRQEGYVPAYSFFAKAICALGLWMLLTLVTDAKPVHANIALSPDPGRGVGIPAYLYDYLTACDTYQPLQSPAFVSWISLAGSAATTTWSVPYGTSSVQLELHLSAAVCAPNSAVTDTGDRTEAASPAGVSGIAGTELYRNYTPYNQVGLYRHASRVFTYAPPGGFTTSGDHVITLTGHGINRFTSGVHLCTSNGANAQGGFNYYLCPTENVGFLIRVNVNAPPQITISGRVFAHPGQVSSGGYANIGIDYTCDGNPDTFTNSSGVFSFTRQQGAGFCIRIPGADPPDTAGGPFVRPRTEGYPGVSPACPAFGSSITSPLVNGNNYCAQTTYEWQAAGVDAKLGGYPPGFSVQDRASNTGFDFVYLVPLPPTLPYLSVFGGDAHAGAVLSDTITSSGCTSLNSSSRLRGRRFDADSGSRGEYGVGATNSIEQFGSAEQVSGNTATFGNTPSDGHFYRTICRPDFTRLASTATISGDTHSIADFNNAAYNNKVVLWTGVGNKTLTGGTLSAGQRVSVITQGSVRITGNIRYKDGATDTPSYNNTGEIPAFLLATAGNLAIDPNVQVITGYYMANGAISTCNNDASNVFSPSITTAAGSATCAVNRLHIYGAIAAHNIYFRRTFGHAANSDETFPTDQANAADLVMMIPELYLSTPPGLSSQSGLRSFLGDLPPVF